MRNAGVGSGSTSWRTLLETGSVAGLSDGALLERFAAQREGAAEAAFAALVARHGPMVQTTCRRLLADPHDADDAFQATFLVLARKAGLIHQPERLAGWLYGTAYRVSRKLKVQSARRRRHESVAALTGDEASPDDDPGRREECRAVCEEVAHLPAAYRVVVVLHALEGLTQDEAARHLGCSDRTFRRRWVRSCNLLRRRLMQRGLAPAAATIASTLAPAPASAGITEAARDAVVDAAISFTAGTVPATASAVRLAQGVIQAMLWNKLKAGALAAGLVLAVGTGIGVRFVLPLASASGKDERPVAKAANADVPEPSPAEQYRALVKRHDDALKIYFDAVEGKTEAEEVEIADRLAPKEDDHVPAIVALAERYPDDPVAFDALLWAVDNTLGSGLEPGGRAARAVDRAMEILARDHAGDPRLGQFCFRMSYHLSPRNDSFLKTIAERSPNRVVRGQATVVLAESLKQEAMWIEIDRRPDAPESIAMVRALVRSEIVPDDATDQDVNDRVAKILQGIKTAMEEFAKEAPADGQQTVKVAGDPEALRRESDRLFARLLAEYGDVPYVRADGRPTRATLGEVAREGRKPGPTILRDDRRFSTIVKEIEAVRQQAYAAKEAAGDGEAGEKAFLAAVPKWADFGPKMWALAEDAPGSSAALDALLWIFGNAVSNKYGWFRDAREERSATLGKAVDILVRDYPAAMDTLICDNPFVPDNSRFELHISSACFEGPHLAPHADRLYQALYERARSRETRGRMGLTLALYLRKEAELGKLLANPSQVDPDYLTMFDPAFIEQVRRSEPRAITRQAEVILERVKGEYGDVRNRNAMGLRRETLGTLAGIELDDIRTLGIGQTAPEIQGEEADGTPMTLAEFRGKVVVLAFFHHEVCDCRAVFPRLRTMVEQFRGRPLVVLGVNNDRRDELKQLKAQGAITWRAWWDGDQPDLDGRGPITARWNPRTYNDFVLIDHRSAIRFRDLTPYNTRFDDTIESLVKQAEADAPGR